MQEATLTRQRRRGLAVCSPLFGLLVAGIAFTPALAAPPGTRATPPASHIHINPALLAGTEETPGSAEVPPGRSMDNARPVGIVAARALLDGKAAAPPERIAARGIETEVTAEIAALARNLRWDPQLLHAFVRNSIDYQCIYGSRRDATRTLLDRRGNDFEQSSLLVALLRESGYTASYIQGTISLTAPELANWLGIPADADVVGNYLGCAGVPCDIWVDGDGALDHVEMDHVWVRANIDGVDYVFDPSMKTHAYGAAIDLGAAMGYNRVAFLAHATNGMTQTADYVRNANRANIRADLTTYAGNLVAYLRANHAAATADEVLGGRSIEPLHDEPLRTALAYATPAALWSAIPAAYQTTLRIRHEGIDITVAVPYVYGRRLVIGYAGDGTPLLQVDDELLDWGNPVTSGATYPITFNVNHPFAAGGGTYGDAEATTSIKAGGFYSVGNSWGGTGRGLIESQRRQLRTFQFENYDPLSAEVLGSTLALVSLTWAAESSRAVWLCDRAARTATVEHHYVGIVGQSTGLYMDWPMMHAGLASLAGDPAVRDASFDAQSGINGALEWGVIDQLQVGSAVSTIKLLDAANSAAQKIFDATGTNYAASVRPNLKSYTAQQLNYLDSLIAAGRRVVLPEYGNLTDGYWTGSGFLVIRDGGGMANMIAGGWWKGGSSTDGGLVDSDEVLNQQQQLKNDGSNPQSNDPVDMYTGYYMRQRTDLVAGQGAWPFALTFERVYSSGARATTGGALGAGWSHNWDLAATKGSDGFRGLGEGTAVDAAAAVVGAYVTADILSAGRLAARLVVANLAYRWFMDLLIDNVVNVSSPDQVVRFAKLANGAYEPPPGTWATLTPLGGGWRLRSAHGRLTDFAADGNATAMSDANGNTIQLTYAAGRLAQVTNSVGQSLALTYDGAGRLTRVRDGANRAAQYAFDTAGRLAAVTNPVGSVVRFAYDAKGRLARVYTPLAPATPVVENAYDDFDRVTAQWDDRGNATAFLVADGARSEEIDPRGYARAMYYDRWGRLTLAVDAAGHPTRYRYDGLGRLLRVTMPEGNAVAFAYDGRGNTVEHRRIAKSGSGLADLVERFAHDAVYNNVTNHTDALGRSTRYTYDAAGNLTRIDLPAVDGHPVQETYTRNARGQPLTSTARDGTVRAHTYAAGSGLLSQTVLDPGGLSRTNRFEHDAVGNLTAFTDPRGNRWSMQYDADRRLTNSVAPAPFLWSTRYTYDANGNLAQTDMQTGVPAAPWATTRVAYGPSGLRLTTTDPAGFVTSNAYDSCSRLWKIGTPDGRVREFTYDGMGRSKRQIDPSGTVAEEHGRTTNGLAAWLKDGKGNASGFQYDGHDRFTRHEFADASGTAYAYDDAGRCTSQVTRAGAVLTKTFDAHNRPRTWHTPSTGLVRYDYDDAGRLTCASNALGRVARTFNRAGQVTSETNPDGRTVGYQYDAAGNRTRLTYPDGAFVTYAYDAMNRVSAIRDSGGALLAEYDYDGLGRVTAQRLGNGTRADYTYDSRGLLATLAHTLNGRTLDFAYTWGRGGDLQGIRPGAPDLMAPPTAFEDVAYTPNALNQLVSANGQPLLYDGNGNLRSEGPRQFTFNARDQMIGGTNGAHTLTLAYDALDRVAVRTVDGQARRCVYDGADLIAEYNQAGTLLRRFVHGVGTDDPIRMTTGAGAHYYYHRDHMGSVIALSDAAGTAVEVYAYSPFGEPTSTGTRGNPFFFAGRIYEQGVARYDYRARHYAPGLGRFVSPDRVGFSGGDMNLYGYCVNSPLMYTDPSGEIMLVPIIVGGVAIVTLVTGYFIDHIESKTDPGGQEAANYGPYIVVGPTWKNQNPVVRESMLIHERKHKYSFHGVQRIWRNEASTELAAYKAQYEYLIKQRNLAEQKGDAATVDAINAYMQSALIETAVTDPSFLPNLYQGQSTIGGIWNAYIEGKQRELESGYPMMLD